MKTIQLTQEQFSLVCQSLGIAEKQFKNIYNTIVDTTISVNTNYGMKAEQSIKSEYYLKMSSEIANLNNNLQNGEFDK